jgi:hypothetical protein
VKCVRRLNLRLVNLAETDGWVQYESTTDVYLEALLRMLEVTKRLEYLRVTVPLECEGYEASFKATTTHPFNAACNYHLKRERLTVTLPCYDHTVRLLWHLRNVSPPQEC